MYSAPRKIRPLSHRSRDARHSRGDYSSILRTYESGYTLEERKKKGGNGRTDGEQTPAFAVSPHFFSTPTSDIRVQLSLHLSFI